VGKPEGNSLGAPRRIWEDNIKMDLREVGALITTVMNLRVPQNAGNFLTS
jgi:hypothetical protein